MINDEEIVKLINNTERIDDNFTDHTITELSFDDNEYNNSDIVSNVVYNITDLDLSDDEREKMLLELTPDLILESLNELMLRYNDTDNNKIYDTIEKICNNDNTPFICRIQFSKCLPRGDLLLSIIKNNYLKEININHTILWDSLLYLYNLNYNVNEEMILIISNSKLDIEYRYKLVRYSDNIKSIIYSFIDSISESQLEFYIYSLQLLKKYSMLTEEYCLLSYNKYFSNPDLSNYLKSDFADFLINTDYKQCKDIASNILKSLSDDFNSLYNNKQNIHIVDTNITGFCLLLTKVVCQSTDEITLNLIISNCYSQNQHISIRRIKLDNGIYSSYSLSNILCRLYWYIQTNIKDKDELLKILYNELDDMTNTCSTGHLYRLINVLTGYVDFITIDPKIEFRDVFKHKLINIIKTSDNYSDIMEGIEDNKEDLIIKYLYPYISILRDVLIVEYKDILTIETIEEEIRKNIINFTQHL